MYEKNKHIFYLSFNMTSRLFIIFTLIFANLSQAYGQVKSQYKPTSTINKWEKVVVRKDFILSNSLQYHRFCRKVWDYQIPEFKKKNPHIKDVNKFEIGDIIDLQLCTDFKFEPIKEELQKDMDNCFIPIEKATPTDLKKSELKPEKDDSINLEEFEPDFTILGTFGGLAEQDEKTQASFGFRLLADITPRIGYRMRLDYATTVLMWHNEALLQTLPNTKGTRFYVGYGLGNRMGLKENLNINLSNKTTAYTTLSLGTVFSVGKGVIDFQVGSNFSNYFSPYASIMASKRLGNTPYTLGGFIDYRSTRSAREQTDENRHWIGAGLLFSY